MIKQQFTTEDVAVRAGISARSVYLWSEARILHPVVTKGKPHLRPGPVGRHRAYAAADIIAAMITREMISRWLPTRTIRTILRTKQWAIDAALSGHRGLIMLVDLDSPRETKVLEATKLLEWLKAAKHGYFAIELDELVTRSKR
jgi:hypothetical protein